MRADDHPRRMMPAREVTVIVVACALPGVLSSLPSPASCWARAAAAAAEAPWAP
jgi:hypothetical protein